MRNNKSLKKRNIKVDNKFNSLLMQRIINYTMYDGKKRKSENLIYKALNTLSNDFKFESNFQLVSFFI